MFRCSHDLWFPWNIPYNPWSMYGILWYILYPHEWFIIVWLVVSTRLKNIRQNGNLPNRGEHKKSLKPPTTYGINVGKYTVRPMDPLGLPSFSVSLGGRGPVGSSGSAICQTAGSTGIAPLNKNKQTNKQTNKKTNKQTNKQKNKQTNKKPTQGPIFRSLVFL